MFLAVDIGGTKGNFALVDPSYNLHSQMVLKISDFSSFDELLDHYLSLHSDIKIKGACLGVAGPVENNTARLTNLDWTISADQIKSKFSISNVWVLNDLEAYAWGVECLKVSELKILQLGVEQSGHSGLIAAGTGLGEANLYYNNESLIPSSSEGSHTGFSPISEDVDFLSWLYKKYDHVSWERVVSGAFGFENIYRYMSESGKVSKIEELEQVSTGFGEILTKHAQQGNDSATTVMNKFCYYYGAEAGNLALKTLTRGGMYVGGGIVGKILPWIESGIFLDGFREKGRFSSLMETIPVKIITDDCCALKGAGRYVFLNSK